MTVSYRFFDIQPRLTTSRREAISFYLSISPWLIGFLAFTLVPMAISLYLGFTRWDLFGSPQWAGMDNYRRMVGDPLFRQALRVTTIYTLAYVPSEMIGGMALALLVNQKVRGVGVFRTVFYLPSVLAGVAYVVLWMWIFNPQAGLLNTLLGYIGIQGPRWLIDPQWALPALLLMTFWGWGRAMVIFLAGLQGVPPDLYEAAAIDGAGDWSKFWHVTLPMLTPTILFALILSVISTFQTFTSAFIATAGGPLDATLFYVLYLYRQAFQFFRMGYAAALAWILFLIVLVLTVILFRSGQFWVYYEGKKE
jgi:multiple sugar transport system permease protein